MNWNSTRKWGWHLYLSWRKHINTQIGQNCLQPCFGKLLQSWFLNDRMHGCQEELWFVHQLATLIELVDTVQGCSTEVEIDIGSKTCLLKMTLFVPQQVFWWLVPKIWLYTNFLFVQEARQRRQLSLRHALPLEGLQNLLKTGWFLFRSSFKTLAQVECSNIS